MIGFYSRSGFTIPLELTLSKIRKNIHTIAHPYAEAPLCEAQSFSKGKGRECANTNADSVLRNYFLGKGFAKPRLLFLKFGVVLNSGSRAEEGSGEESARVSFLDFLAGGQLEKIPIK